MSITIWFLFYKAMVAYGPWPGTRLQVCQSPTKNIVASNCGMCNLGNIFVKKFALGDPVCIIRGDNARFIQIPSLLCEDVRTFSALSAYARLNPLKYTWFINLSEENENTLCQIGIFIPNGLET
ncbi:hypothetical protein TNCV_1046701 [Trichonephila clavipes]|nr:hypothetical protein TNCV_1046701 [Trichonephila clavipes]